MMKMMRAVVFVMLAALCLAAQEKETTPQETTPQLKTFTVIRAGTLIDGKSDSPRRDQVIVIRGNRIDSVSDAASAKIPSGSTVIDLSRATVLPGLIDSHTHIFLQGEDPAGGGYDIQLLKYPASFRAARATVSARRALEQGFTTLRDLETEGAGYGDVGIKEAIEAGYIPGPRMFVVTRAISTTGGYPLDGGCDSIEHGLELTDAQIAQMVKQGTWYVPTLAVYYYDWSAENTDAGRRDRKRAAVHGASFNKALKAGVKIAFGTDIGGIPWTDPIAQEFAREVEFGMTPMQAIQTATARAAELLEMQGKIGVIAPGAYADVIAVSDDPLRDVNALKNVTFVMTDGQVDKSAA